MICNCASYPFPHRWGGGCCTKPRYKCHEGHYFTKPNSHTFEQATWGYSGGTPEDWDWVCPECGAEDFDKLEEVK